MSNLMDCNVSTDENEGDGMKREEEGGGALVLQECQNPLHNDHKLVTISLHLLYYYCLTFYVIYID